MAISEDQFRQYIDEVETLIEQQKNLIREAKEYISNSFTFKSIDELLYKRRRAFDHAFTNCSLKYSLGRDKVRTELDRIWGETKISQSEWKKYIRLLKFIPSYGIGYLDDTQVLIYKKWDVYLTEVGKLAKGFNHDHA